MAARRICRVSCLDLLAMFCVLHIIHVTPCTDTQNKPSQSTPVPPLSSKEGYPQVLSTSSFRGDPFRSSLSGDVTVPPLSSEGGVIPKPSLSSVRGVSATLSPSSVGCALPTPSTPLVGSVVPNLARCRYASCYSIKQCASGKPGLRNKRIVAWTSISPCFCDDVCQVFGDCCFDFFPTCLGVSLADPEAMVNQRRRLFRTHHPYANLRILLKYSECLSVTTKGSSHYIMISKCPGDNVRSFPPQLVAKCHNQTLSVFGKIPVTHIDFRYVTFRNIFCALCHGFARKDVLFWNTYASCPPIMETKFDEEVNRRMLSENCTINATADIFGKPRTCSPLVAAIPPCLDLDTDMCSYYQYVMQDKNLSLHKNPHCAGVNTRSCNVQTPYLECAWVWTRFHKSGFNPQTVSGAFLIPGHHYPDKMSPSSGSVGGLGVLFQFSKSSVSFATQRGNTKQHVQYCPSDQVYDFYIDSCKTLTCAPDKKPVNGNCVLHNLLAMNYVHHDEHEENSSFWIVFSLLLQEDISTSNRESQVKLDVAGYMDYCSQENQQNVTVLSVSRYNSTQCVWNNSTNLFLDNLLESSDDVAHFLISIQATEISTHNRIIIVHCMYKMSITYSDASPIIHFTMFNRNPQSCPVCSNNTKRAYTNIKIASSSIHFKHQSRTEQNGVLDNLTENVLFGIVFRANENASQLVICDTSMSDNLVLHCSNGSLEYDSNEYTLNNQTVTLHENGKSYGPGSYSVHDSHVSVCNHEFISKHNTHNTGIYFCNDHVNEVITIVTSLISMLSLGVVLVVYWLLPCIMNDAGRIVVSLSGSMMLAQGLLLIMRLPRGRRVLCAVTAALIHAAWLSSFLWMTILSIDLTRTIRGMLPTPNPRLRSRMYIRYALTAWLGPIFLVGACLLVDFLHIPYLPIGYGGSQVCWISNLNASAILFGVPMAITLLVNVCCFVLTLSAIESTSRAMQGVTFSGKSNRRKLGVYARLILIMGMTWIIAFIAPFAGIQALCYCQAVLNGLQGFYLFIGFIVKKRIASLLLIAWNKRRRYDSNTSLYTVSSQ